MTKCFLGLFGEFLHEKMLSPEPRTDNQDAQKPRAVVFPRSYEFFSNHSHPLLHPPLKVDWNFQRMVSFCFPIVKPEDQKGLSFPTSNLFPPQTSEET